MDPEVRTLLQVTIDETEDVDKSADTTFKTLMGDEVEPRRNFIINGAKFVSNLDL